MPKKLKVELALEDRLSNSLSLARQKINTFTHSVNRTFRSIMSVPSMAMAIIGSGIGIMAKSFITAAEKIEVFERQLMAVSKTAQEAKDSLNAIREFARISPLETEDVVKAYVRLRAVGIDPTIEQMRTLGGVALLFNTTMEDMTNSFIGLNKKTLRQFGVEISRTKKEATIVSGDFKRTVTNDAGEIRKVLLELWENRFPGAIEKMSGTFSGQMEIMRSNVFEFQAQLGQQFLPAITGMVTKLGSFIESQIKHINKYSAVIFGIIYVIRDYWNKATIVMRTLVSGIVQVIMAFVTLAKVADKVVNSIIDSFSALGNTLFRMIKEKRFDFGNIITEEMGKVDFKAIWTEMETGLQNITTLQNVTAKQNVKDATDIINAWKAVGKAYKTKIELPKTELKGTGNLGGAGDEDEKGKGKKITDSLLEGYRIGLEQREKLLKEAEENEAKIVEDMVKRRLEIVEQLRILEVGEDQYKYEEQLRIQKVAYDQGIINKNEYEILLTDITKRETDRRAAILKNEVWSTINANMRLGSSLSRLAEIGLQNSKMAAKKRQNILIALAVAEGAASAVTAAKAGWDSAGGNYYLGAVLAAAGIIEAIGIVAGQIATIKSQKFARGTSFAPGGRALVGEEGPEMAEFPRGTRIRTAAETRQFFGGTTISPTIIINGNADRNTVSQIQNTLNDFGKKFTQAIRTGNIDLKHLGIMTR